MSERDFTLRINEGEPIWINRFIQDHLSHQKLVRHALACITGLLIVIVIALGIIIHLLLR